MRRPRGQEGLRVDRRDLQILHELEKDARIPWRQLARNLGVSETTIYLRVKRLEEKGILRGYTARIDPVSLGLVHRAIVMIRVLVSGLETARKAIPAMKYVYRLLEVTGPHNLVVEIWAPSREDLLETVRSLEKLPGVEEVIVLYVLDEIWRARTITGDILKIGGARSSESLRP
ncbi:MAG: Lrp/AsnC family transcriptional regulator [Desulfurococcales archaeon]|nr:Lrp/AsnC family transcriptional regulator [Desulfurococcales archaeon]